MNKTIRLGLLLAVAFALLLGINTLSAIAAGPNNTAPAVAAVLDNQAHTIQGNSTLWYRFDYAGDRSQVTISLVNGANGQVAFNVFTPQQINDWWETKPIGRGTVFALNCNTGRPAPEGQCTSNDLSWGGQFPFAGTYYVQVINYGPGAASAQLLIQGSGVSLAQPAASSPAATPNFRGGAAAPPPATSLPNAVTGNTFTNIDPGHAAVLDNTAHAIAANSSLWYRFSYAGDKSQVTIQLVNGANGPVAFNVFTPEQIDNWWQTAPIGRGTILTLNCNNGLPAPLGLCQSSDLSWTGQFNAAGNYYVQVVNNASTPLSPLILIQGSGVTLGK